MLLDAKPFAEFSAHFKGRHYRNPNALATVRDQLERVLLIGSCITDFLTESLGIAVDRIVYNGGITPVLPKDASYQAQIWQLPLRLLIDNKKFWNMQFADAEESERLLNEAADRLTAYLDRFARVFVNPDVPVFILNYLVPTGTPIGRLQRRHTLANPQHFIAELNRRLEADAAERGAHVVDIDQIANGIGKNYFTDELTSWYSHNSFYWFIDDGVDGSRIETSPHMTEHFAMLDRSVFNDAVASEIQAMYRTYRGADAIKMVVMDLDDTLWKGVIGDASTAWDDNPYRRGELAHLAEGWPRGLAEALMFLKRRGVILGILSRNDFGIVAKHFDQIFEGDITLDDFAVKFIDFEDKAANMAQMLRVVNIDPSSVLFIDDNPIERAKMDHAFPTMRIIGRYFLYHRQLLLGAPELQRRFITDESARRSEMIAKQVQREDSRRLSSDADFLASLGLRIKAAALAPDDDATRLQRCVELTNKTNQWNSAGCRTDLGEVRTFLSAGGTILGFTAWDNFTSYGEICFIGLMAGNVTHFVMSCRTAGLGVETACLRIALEYAKLTSARIAYRRTDKNSPVRMFLERFDFDGEAFHLSLEGLPRSEYITLDLAPLETSSLQPALCELA